MVVGPLPGVVGGARLQLVERLTLEILHTAHGSKLLTVDQIPPVAHLEDIGTLIEAVPHHVHKLSVTRPVLQIARKELCQRTLVVGCRRHDHVPLAIVTFEDEGVSEVGSAVTIVDTTENEGAALGPCLEVR